MIRLKLFYTEKDYMNSVLCEAPIHRYSDKDFYRLVQGYAGEEKTGPPFRDADSVKFIREIDKAEFVKDDWYSVVTPFGRTNMTALCGGTQYALTVIANSRRGIYTQFKGYGDDIWSRLASLSMDVLIYCCVNIYSEDWHYLPFEDETRKRVVIENYRYKDEEVEAYLGNGFSKSVIDGKLYVSRFFEEFRLDWSKNLGIFIQGAEYLLERDGQLYKHLPTITNIEEFAKTMDERQAGMFNEYLGEPGIWEPDLDGFMREKAFLESLSVHNYMLKVPKEPIVKYPIYFIIRRRKGTCECTISKKTSCKNPSFSSLLLEDFVRLSDCEKAEFEKLAIVFDIEFFGDANKVFKWAILAFKLYDNVVEIYDGIHVAKEFVDFVKPSYEANSLTAVKGVYD